MMNTEMIEKCEAAGMTRWTRYGKDRLYISASILGLHCTYYKTGSISTATLNGEHISNSEGYRLKQASTYIDVETGELKGTYTPATKLARALLDTIIG